MVKLNFLKTDLTNNQQQKLSLQRGIKKRESDGQASYYTEYILNEDEDRPLLFEEYKDLLRNVYTERGHGKIATNLCSILSENLMHNRPCLTVGRAMLNKPLMTSLRKLKRFFDKNCTFSIVLHYKSGLGREVLRALPLRAWP